VISELCAPPRSASWNSDDDAIGRRRWARRGPHLLLPGSHHAPHLASECRLVVKRATLMCLVIKGGLEE